MNIPRPLKSCLQDGSEVDRRLNPYHDSHEPTHNKKTRLGGSFLLCVSSMLEVIPFAHLHPVPRLLSVTRLCSNQERVIHSYLKMIVFCDGSGDGFVVYRRAGS
jgi:hypothetical protein